MEDVCWHVYGISHQVKQWTQEQTLSWNAEVGFLT
jgi:hypothetical protein